MSNTKAKSEYTEIDGIKEDLNSLKTNVVELTKAMKKDTSEHAMDLRDIAMNRMNGLKESGQQQVENIERHVKEKPAQSIAIALLAGFALSALMKRG